MIQSLSKNMEVYYASMLSDERNLVMKHWDIPSYKACLKQICDFLINSVVTFQDQQKLLSLVAYAFCLYRKEEQLEGDARNDIRTFINTLRKDLGERLQHEIALRIE